MNKGKSSRQRGNSAVELAIVFVPLMFLMLSTFELGRGMWMYHTLTSSLKSGLRFAVVHGADCIEVSEACRASLGDVAQVISQAGIGLSRDDLQLTFAAGATTVDCGTLSQCAGRGSQWPPDSENTAGLPITISGVYSFRSVLSGFWPGQNNGVITFVGRATEAMQF